MHDYDHEQLIHLAGCHLQDLGRRIDELQARERRFLNFIRRVANGETALEFEAARLLNEFEESGPTERPECVGAEF